MAEAQVLPPWRPAVRGLGKPPRLQPEPRVTVYPYGARPALWVGLRVRGGSPCCGPARACADGTIAYQVEIGLGDGFGRSVRLYRWHSEAMRPAT